MMPGVCVLQKLFVLRLGLEANCLPVSDVKTCTGARFSAFAAFCIRRQCLSLWRLFSRTYLQHHCRDSDKAPDLQLRSLTAY